MSTRDSRLDVLRAVAIFLVLGRHCRIYWLWQRIGWAGVDLFFVLSGFLIAGLLFAEYRMHGRIRLKRFYFRRALKIYPPFYALMLVTALTFPVWNRAMADVAPPWAVPFNARLYAAEIFFVQNYWHGYWWHTWSLGVEEHFYLILPLCLVWLTRTRQREPFRPIPWMFLSVSVVELTLRCLNPHGAKTEYHAYLFPTHYRMDSLFAGVALAYLYHFRRPVFERLAHAPWLLLGSSLLVAPVFFLDVERSQTMYSFGITGLYLGFAGILTWCLGNWKKQQSYPVRMIALIGTFSYSIYLWHMAVLSWGTKAFHGLARHIPGGIAMYNGTWRWFYIIGSVLFGIAMAKLIEVPVLGWRDKRSGLLKSRPSPQSAQVSLSVGVID